VCRSGSLDTLIIFTTRISVSNMYSTNIVVIVPIIWLYITVVVVILCKHTELPFPYACTLVHFEITASIQRWAKVGLQLLVWKKPCRL